ncbi:MAG: hypothetical protein B7Z55_16335 [Planctomycetales bacterium 12-60-4]|nr:MAG: hypothetical protein B7Z55_16335 [Planctomycetales bacterium 12-60-4]
MNSQSIATAPTLFRQVNKPIGESKVALISAPPAPVDGEPTDTAGVTISALGNDSKISTVDATPAIGDLRSDLLDSDRWQLDPLPGARTKTEEFNHLFETSRPASLVERMWDDQKNFYSPKSLTLLGGGLVIGGAMANTSIDDGIHRHFQSSVRGATSDDWFEFLHASKELGNGKYTLPVFATAWAAGELFPGNQLVETSGRWGERSIRGFLVGAPPLIIMQQLTGGSRPTETNESSEWHPMRDNNGISGHAFMGSLPFITAAKMTDNRGYKFLFYAGSAIAPLSRVNDNAHYPSQVALGWWMAYLAASAIDATDNPNARWRFYPYSTGDGSGMMAEFRY